MSNARYKFYNWLLENLGEDLFTSQIVDAAEQCFAPPTFTTQVRVDAEDPTFEGVVDDIDVKPLNGDAKTVFEFMARHEGEHFTPEEIRAATGVTERSITSHLRNFRLPKWGGHDTPKRRRANQRTWEYAMYPNKDSFTYRKLQFTH